MDSLATPAGVAAAVAAAGAVAVCTRCTLGGSGGVSSRAEQAVVGGLCGDAAAVTSHWCYDQEELAATIKKAGGEQNAPFIDPINAYYHVEPGQLSCCAPTPPPSYSNSYSCSCLPACRAGSSLAWSFHPSDGTMASVCSHSQTATRRSPCSALSAPVTPSPRTSTPSSSPTWKASKSSVVVRQHPFFVAILLLNDDDHLPRQARDERKEC